MHQDGKGRTDRPRVLAIDDESLILECLRRILRQQFDLVTTSSPTEAVAWILGGERFDAILCDLMMPRLSGMEVHGTLARYYPDQAARMVFVTGGVTRPDQAAFLQQTTLPCIFKPFTVEVLRETLVNVTRGRIADPEVPLSGGEAGRVTSSAWFPAADKSEG